MPTSKAKLTKKQLENDLASLSREFGEVMAQVNSLQTQNHILTIEYTTERNAHKATQGKVDSLVKRLAAEKEKNDGFWSSIYDVLGDSGVIHHVRGWYWHTERKQPVYVDGISEDGLVGFSLTIMEDQFIGSVTDIFDFKHLIRIDTNLEFQL